MTLNYNNATHDFTNVGMCIFSNDLKICYLMNFYADPHFTSDTGLNFNWITVNNRQYRARNPTTNSGSGYCIANASYQLNSKNFICVLRHTNGWYNKIVAFSSTTETINTFTSGWWGIYFFNNIFNLWDTTNNQYA